MNLSEQKNLAPADCSQLQKPLAVYKEPRGVFIPAAYLAHFNDEPMARFVSHVMYRFKRGKNGNRKPLTERDGAFWLKNTWKQMQADTGLTRRQLDRLKKRATDESIFIIETSGWGADNATFYRPVCANGADVIDGYPTIEAIKAAASYAPSSATENKELGSYAPPSASICTPECTHLHPEVHPLYKEDEVLEKKLEGKTLGGASLGPTPEPAPDKSGKTNPANPTPDPKPETTEFGKQESEGTTPLDTPKGKSLFNKMTNQLTGKYVDRLEAVWKLQPGHVSNLSPAQRGKLRNFGEKLLAAGLDPLRVLHALVTTPSKWKAFAAAVHAKYATYKDKPNIDVLGTTKYLDVLINWVIETRKQKAEQAAKSAAQAAAKGQQVGKVNPTPAKPTSGPGAFTPEEWAERLKQKEAYIALCAKTAAHVAA